MSLSFNYSNWIPAQQFIELTAVEPRGDLARRESSLYPHWTQLSPSAPLMSAREPFSLQTVTDTRPSMKTFRTIKDAYSTRVCLSLLHILAAPSVRFLSQ